MILSKTVKILSTVCAALVVFTTGALFFVSVFPRETYVAEIVAENCKRFSLDENLVLSVIKCESNFHPEARSSVGALGLMQVMPETADFIARKAGITDYDLFSADDNIFLGCAYLRYLFDRFSDEKTVIAAYNAGEGRITEWLKNERFSSDGSTLDNIPIRETERYVRRVLLYKHYYSLTRKLFGK